MGCESCGIMLEGMDEMPKRNRSILREKWREALTSVMPITGLVFALCLTLVPVSNDSMMGFVVGAALLILGMGLFTLGADMAMMPIGQHVGTAMTRSKKAWVVALMGFVVGMLITLSEPDLQVLAEQVPGVPNIVLMVAVGVGVGLFLVLALMRILLRVRMSHLLFICYALVFILAQFVPKSFLAVAFDSGGVTTGPMTVPFILALGVGVSAMRSDSNAENDSFGLVALCSVGPILAVMVLGMMYRSSEASYTAAQTMVANTSTELGLQFANALPKYLKEVGVALVPIAVFFFGMQVTSLHLSGASLIKIVIGLVYTYVGLVMFLLGVNVGFMPVGNLIGRMLGGLDFNWILVPVGMVIGYFVVAAEPAVHVLNKQVYEITSGAIPQKAMSISLSIGVSISVGLAMLRILTGLPIMALLLPGYVLALLLMLFVPPIFTSIAFDSGGVASGPMTATFLLPFAMGACTAVGGDVVSDAFGVVAMVAMTPLITIQILGVYYRIKQRSKKVETPEQAEPVEDIIDL